MIMEDNDMFAERLDFLPVRLAQFRLVAPATDRGAWGGLPADLRRRLLTAGEDALAKTWPLLPATAYLDYARNGNRTRFEELYLTRRRMLNALVMAECVEAQGRFLDAIIDGVFLLCEESGWQLPAHNSYVRGGQRLALPAVDRPVIDLFAAETGAQLALVSLLLGDALDSASPEITGRIDREVSHRILAPYSATHFWWMGNGSEPMNNWTAWCTQNVLISAFVLEKDPAALLAIVRKAAVSLDAFLKDYGDDGACEEGALYYRHAGLCLFNALDLLGSAAPEAFSPLWGALKIRNIAEYIVNVHVDGQHYFNFADCSAVTERCGAREFLFGGAVGSKLLTDFAAGDGVQDEAADLPDEINLFYRVQAAFATADMRAYRTQGLHKTDIFYPSIGLMVARDDRFALAVKAGDNGDSHNHNDIGSFTVYRDGEPLLIDVGVESYTAKTFSPRRYEIWTMQSAFHNLPTFGGVMQQDGAQFAARDVVVSLDPAEARIEMEIAGAYPAAAGLRNYRRTVRLIKGRGIEVDDHFDGDLPATLSLMLAQRPAVAPGTLTLDGLCNIEIAGAGKLEVEEIAISDPRLLKAWPSRLYRVLLPITGSRLTLTIV